MSTSDWSEEELSRLIEYDAALTEGSGEEVRDQLSLPGDEALEAGASIITMLHRYYETEVRKQADPATGDAGDAAQMSRKIGRFEIAGELGRGGCGLVYRAYDPAMARDVALKVIIDDLPLDGIRRSRFFREARVAGRLNHPHLVTLFDIGQSEGELFLAMELCAGLDLDRVLGKERTPMPWRDAVALVWAIAQGLGHAHSHGITHRDVKPGNILLQPEKPTTAEQPQSEVGDSAIFSTTKSASRSNKSQTQKGQPVLIFGSWYVPKLGDFGLACLTSASGDHTAMGTIIGTPNYMAPEQAQGQRDRVGPPTDVYALGCVLYELLTGRPPIVGNDPADTLRRIVADRPVSLHRRDRNVPRDINVICMKCLQHDPQARYANANELADDLRRVLEGDPIHRRPLAAKSVAVAVGLGACWLLIILGWSKLSSFWQPPASVRPAAVATTPPKLSSSVLETPASFKPIHHYRFIPQKSNPQAILDSVGTAHGLICSPTRTCKLEAAGQLRISQLSDYVEIPAEYLQDLENVTVEIWFTPTSQAYSWNNLWHFDNGHQGRARNLFEYAFRSLDNHRVDIAQGRSNYTAKATLPVEVNSPSHFVATFAAEQDGTAKICLYYNGMLASTARAKYRLADIRATRLQLGPIIGIFHEVCVNGEALSPQQVAETYSKGMRAHLGKERK